MEQPKSKSWSGSSEYFDDEMVRELNNVVKHLVS